MSIESDKLLARISEDETRKQTIIDHLLGTTLHIYTRILCNIMQPYMRVVLPMPRKYQHMPNVRAHKVTRCYGLIAVKCGQKCGLISR